MIEDEVSFSYNGLTRSFFIFLLTLVR